MLVLMRICFDYLAQLQPDLGIGLPYLQLGKYHSILLSRDLFSIIRPLLQIRHRYESLSQ